MLKVPITLSVKSRAGSSRLTLVEQDAPRWTIRFASFAAIIRPSRPGSVVGEPSRLSMHVGMWPRSMSAWTRWLPMNPAAPVTRMFIG
jgi:hypothetical protein